MPESDTSLCRRALRLPPRASLHERSPLVNLSQPTCRAGLPALSCCPALPGAQGDSQRPLPRPRVAGPVPIHSVRPLGPPSGEPPDSAPLCGTSGRLGSAVAVPGHQARDARDSAREEEPRTPLPRTYLPTSAPSGVKKATRAERSSVPSPAEKREPHLPVTVNLWCPKSKQKVSPCEKTF